MYCSSCGHPVAEGLSYCKQCGTSLVPSVTVHEPAMLAPRRASGGLGLLIAFAIIVTAGISLGGLAMVLILVEELVRMSFPVKNITALAIASLLMIMGAAALVGRQLSRLISAYQPTAMPAPASKSLPHEPRTFTQIPSFREPTASVTEHTTRTFEPSHKEPRIS